MGETSRPWIERIFWMIAFIISTIGCALLISEMFEKLQTNPITVSLAERPSSIQEVSETQIRIIGRSRERSSARLKINCGLIHGFTLVRRSHFQLLPVSAFFMSSYVGDDFSWRPGRERFVDYFCRATLIFIHLIPFSPTSLL